MNIAKRKWVVAVGILSVILNTCLFIVKYGIGTAENSIAIKADAWHTLSDSFSSIVVIAGAWMSARGENKKHPYGYGRLEEITSIIVGVLLGFVGFEFIRESLSGLMNHQSLVYSRSAYIIMIVTIVVKEVLARVSIIIGRKQNSLSLVADGWHHRSDAISSAIVLVGLFAGAYFYGTDSVLGIAVSLMILYAAFGIIREASGRILGEPCPEELIGRVVDLSGEVTPEITDLHNFRLHSYGDYSEIVFHCRMPGSIHLKRAHDTVSILEKAIFESLSLRSTIHMECNPPNPGR